MVVSLVIGVATSGCAETISTAGLPDEPAGLKTDSTGTAYISKEDVGKTTDMGQNHYNIVVVCKEQEIDCEKDAIKISYKNDDPRKIQITAREGNIRPIHFNAFDADGKYIESTFYASYPSVSVKDQVWEASPQEEASFIQIVWSV